VTADVLARPRKSTDTSPTVFAMIMPMDLAAAMNLTNVADPLPKQSIATYLDLSRLLYL
jgi:hypothetical protein